MGDTIIMDYEKNHLMPFIAANSNIDDHNQSLEMLSSLDDKIFIPALGILLENNDIIQYDIDARLYYYFLQE